MIFIDLFIILFIKAYRLIFHTLPDEKVINYARNFIYIVIGTIPAMFLLFIFNVLTGRILNTVDYGKYVYIQSLSSFLYIPMLLGYNTALIKYAADKSNKDRQKEIITIALLCITVLTLLTVILYCLFADAFIKFLSIDSDVFYYSLILGILITFSSMASAILKAIFKMKVYSYLQFGYALILIVIFLIIYYLNDISFRLPLISIFIAYLGIIIITLFYVRKYFTFKIDFGHHRILTKYSLITTIGAISYVINSNFDKLLINKYMSTAELGIYGVYYLSSLYITDLLFNMFNSIFFPAISAFKEKTVVFKQIRKFMPYLLLFGIPLIFIAQIVILFLFGNKYPMDFVLMLLFAITAITTVLYGLYDWTFHSEGIKGVVLINVCTFSIALSDIVLNLYLIPHYGLYGAIVSKLLAYVIGILMVFSLKRYID